MKKILVVGGGTYQAPLIKRIREKGYEAYCVDKNPDAPGFEYANGYEIIDVLDKDACLDYAKKLGISAVMTYGATLPHPTVSYIGKALGLATLPMETALISTNKYLIKKRFAESGCNTKGVFFKIPSRDKVNKNDFVFPCVIKPCDGSGSKGVSVVETEAELDKALDYAFDSARYGEVYCESYIPGKEYGVETFVANGKVYVYGIEKITITRHGPNNTDIEYGHTIPSGLSAEDERNIEIDIEKAVRSLNVTMMSVNFDIIFSDEDKKPYIIDCGIRIGQNLIASHIIPYSRGVSIIDNSIELALSNPCDAEPKYKKCISTRLLIEKPGVITEIKPFDALIGKDGIRDIVMCKNVGDRQRIYQDKSDKCGWVVCEGETPDDAESRSEKARKLLESYIITE